VPPCISQLESGLVQVAIEVEDRSQRSAITSTFNIVILCYVLVMCFPLHVYRTSIFRSKC
jgi:hypothetical protein